MNKKNVFNRIKLMNKHKKGKLFHNDKSGQSCNFSKKVATTAASTAATAAKLDRRGASINNNNKAARII